MDNINANPTSPIAPKQEATTPGGNTPLQAPKKKGLKRTLLILLLIILAGGFIFYISKQRKTSPADRNTTPFFQKENEMIDSSSLDQSLENLNVDLKSFENTMQDLDQLNKDQEKNNTKSKMDEVKL